MGLRSGSRCIMLRSIVREGPRRMRSLPWRKSALLSSLRASCRGLKDFGVGDDRPTLRVPLLRERTGSGVSSKSDRSEETAEDNTAFPVGRVTVSNGAIVFFDPQTGWENRVDDVNASVTLGADQRINITGEARPGDRSPTFTIAATLPAGSPGRRNIPTELKIEISGASPRRLTARAEVRINGEMLLINGLSGSLDGGKFNGWASVDLSSKPLVKVDLDFQRLDLGAAASQPSARAPARNHGAMRRPMSAN